MLNMPDGWPLPVPLPEGFPAPPTAVVGATEDGMEKSERFRMCW